MAVEEIVIGHCVDPDFGALELIETRFEAEVNAAPKKPFVFRQWTNNQAEPDVALSISGSIDPPIVAAADRADFRSAISSVDTFKRRIARSQLELAWDWTTASGTDLRLDEISFASLLRIEYLRVPLDRSTHRSRRDHRSLSDRLT